MYAFVFDIILKLNFKWNNQEYFLGTSIGFKNIASRIAFDLRL